MKIKKFNNYISESINDFDLDNIYKELDNKGLKYEIKDGKIIINGLDYKIFGYDSSTELLADIFKDNNI